MGKPSSRRADRRKSRKGQDNMYTRRNSRPQAQRAQNTPPPAEAPTRSSKPKQATSSESKLGSHLDMEFDQEDGLSGFRFIDVSLLIEFVSKLLCPTCKRPMGENKRLSHVSESRSSLASKFEFTCQCQMKQSFWTSAKLTKTYEVNRRFAVAMFAIGRNQQQGTRFLGNMNMPASMYKTSWVHHKKAILQATERTAEESTKKAAADLKAAKGDQVTVSCDGTWQRRGFQSKNGVFTLLSADKQNSKVIDTVTMSSYCDSCAKNKKKKTPEEFIEWRDHDHIPKGECDKNHDGPAGGMEAAGALTAFQRSVDQHQLKYVSFLGDGDSKAYASVSSRNIYPNLEIKKLECCGHVQKRMGRQLTSKVTELKKTKFPKNGKTVTGIGGKGGLTKKAILAIQGHYGAAIRNNSGNVKGMKKAIWAIWEHRNKIHDNCGAWCPSKKNPPEDPNRNALPQFACEAIKPVFQRLSDDVLLQKCAHGGTQNTNESFHNIIWERCPKTVFVGRPRLAIAVADATVAYNDGELGRLSIFTKLGMPQGFYTIKCFQELDRQRIRGAGAALDPAE
ncbi:uncharacterized protein, partial [Littorina saxatilis]